MTLSLLFCQQQPETEEYFRPKHKHM